MAFALAITVGGIYRGIQQPAAGADLEPAGSAAFRAFDTDGPAADTVLPHFAPLVAPRPARAAPAVRRLGLPPIAGPSACDSAISEAERRYRIPPHVLRAVGLTEAGQAGTVYPWTANIAGASRFYSSKEAAISGVSEALDQGVASVDVGCLQVNLHWHPNAFASLAEAFDPAVNVDYGAAYLRALHDQHEGSWTKAVQFYHSSTSHEQLRYLCAVLRRFHGLSGQGEGDISRWCEG